MSKKKIQYGKVEISDEDFKQAKVRVTTFIDLDILKALKQEALVKKTKYQTLMNQLLHDAIFGKQIDARLRKEITEIVKKEIEKKSA
jgi:predicted DNA binding CopG/RHH family protein